MRNVLHALTTLPLFSPLSFSSPLSPSLPLSLSPSPLPFFLRLSLTYCEMCISWLLGCPTEKCFCLTNRSVAACCRVTGGEGEKGDRRRVGETGGKRGTAIVYYDMLRYTERLHPSPSLTAPRWSTLFWSMPAVCRTRDHSLETPAFWYTSSSKVATVHSRPPSMNVYCLPLYSVCVCVCMFVCVSVCVCMRVCVCLQ